MIPDVTVVVTTWNGRAKWMLARAVQSVRGMAKVVIADDGDGPIEHTYLSWRLGVESTETEFVCILHDDDWYEPLFLEQCRAAMTSDCGYAFTNATIHKVDGTTEPNFTVGLDDPAYVRASGLEDQLRRLSHAVSPSCCMFRRADVLQNLMPYGVPGAPKRSVTSGPDLLLTLLPLLKYDKFGVSPDPLVNFQAHPGSVTTQCVLDPAKHEELNANYADAWRYYDALKAVKR